MSDGKKEFRRYGFNSIEVDRLTQRWAKRIKNDSTWKNVDEFIRWCSESGYSKGRFLRKIKQDIPYGPDNCYWVGDSVVNDDVVRYIKAEVPNPDGKVSDLCKICKVKNGPRCATGCRTWYENFACYWDKHIHRKVDVSNLCAPFQYNHPDEVREGIVWSGN